MTDNAPHRPLKAVFMYTPYSPSDSNFLLRHIPGAEIINGGHGINDALEALNANQEKQIDAFILDAPNFSGSSAEHDCISAIEILQTYLKIMTAEAPHVFLLNAMGTKQTAQFIANDTGIHIHLLKKIGIGFLDDLPRPCVTIADLMQAADPEPIKPAARSGGPGAGPDTQTGALPTAPAP